MTNVAKASLTAGLLLAAVGAFNDVHAQQCTGEDKFWCTACDECIPRPDWTTATPSCETIPKGESVDGLVLGYFSGCTEYLPCDEMIPCSNPISEENTPEDVALLAKALGRTVADAQKYVDRYQGRITFDEARNAVQIVGCNDAVKAHLPLSQPAVAQARMPRLRSVYAFVATVLTRARSFAVALV